MLRDRQLQLHHPAEQLQPSQEPDDYVIAPPATAARELINIEPDFDILAQQRLATAQEQELQIISATIEV